MKRSTDIAGKRSERSFGHWNDRRPSARPDAARPDAGAAPPSTSAPAPRRPAPSARPPGDDLSSRGRPDWSPLAPSDDTRARLQLLAQRREAGELMRELGDSADSADPANLVDPTHEPASPSAVTRNGLRALADRRPEAANAPEAAADGEQQLWNRVLGIAAPLVNPQGDRPAR